MKVCTKCKIEKDESEFNKGNGKNGTRSCCKICKSNYQYIKKYGFIPEKPIILDGFKKCSKCKIIKSKNEFGKLKNTKDGLNYNCKFCRVAEIRELRSKQVKNNLCQCGCGNYCKNKYVSGHGCRGREESEAQKIKIGIKSKGRKQPIESVIKRANKQRGKKHSDERKRHNSEGHMGHEVTDKTRKLLSVSIKQLWQDEDYVRNLIRKSSISPNKAELLLLKILSYNFPNKYKFVGDGKLILGGKCPDFVDDDNKKLIELFGEYWHKPEEETQRIEHFRKFGYETLVVWYNEIKSDKLLDKLLSKLNEFIL